MSEDPTKLLVDCLKGESFAWERFVDRFLPLISRIVEFELAELHSDGKPPEELQQRYVKKIFRHLAANDMDLLRRYNASSNLATYLTVIAQRVVNNSPDEPTP